MNSNSRQAVSSRQNTVCLCTVHVTVDRIIQFECFSRIALISARIMEQRKFDWDNSDDDDNDDHLIK